MWEILALVWGCHGRWLAWCKIGTNEPTFGEDQSCSLGRAAGRVPMSWLVRTVGNSVRSHGVAVTLVGIGADAAPAGQRPGPNLSPWEDCSVGDSSLIGDGSLL